MSTMFAPGAAIGGGIVIGVSAALLLLFAGRIAGITGILGGALHAPGRDGVWRLLFLAGLLVGGGLMNRLMPSAFAGQLPRSPGLLLLAGGLVGFGARLGNGCTSGHGVCGIGRLSRRSIVATAVFMTSAILTVWLYRIFAVGGAG